MATANQIAYFKAKEEARHNVVYEQEYYRHNTATERASIFSALLNAETERYKSDQAVRASKYSADLNYSSSIYGTDKRYASSIYNTDVASQTNIYTSLLSKESAKYVADTNAATSRYVAKLNAQTSRYVADTNKAASRYVADTNKAASKYAADSSRSASRYSANESAYASMYNANLQRQNVRDQNAASRYSADLVYKAKQEDRDSREVLTYYGYHQTMALESARLGQDYELGYANVDAKNRATDYKAVGDIWKLIGGATVEFG